MLTKPAANSAPNSSNPPFALLQAGNEIIEKVTNDPDAKTINTFPLSSTIPFMNLLCGLSWLSWLDDWTSAGGR